MWSAIVGSKLTSTSTSPQILRNNLNNLPYNKEFIHVMVSPLKNILPPELIRIISEYLKFVFRKYAVKYQNQYLSYVEGYDFYRRYNIANYPLVNNIFKICIENFVERTMYKKFENIELISIYVELFRNNSNCSIYYYKISMMFPKKDLNKILNMEDYEEFKKYLECIYIDSGEQFNIHAMKYEKKKEQLFEVLNKVFKDLLCHKHLK